MKMALCNHDDVSKMHLSHEFKRVPAASNHGDGRLGMVLLFFNINGSPLVLYIIMYIHTICGQGGICWSISFH